MAEETSTINLKILSPSSEVEGGVNFSDLPTTITIHELRNRIQDAVPTRPAPERMRLIYRGRVVADDAVTLGHVFGADNIRESRDQSLHLVLRELPPSDSASSSPAPRSATAPPNPFRPAQPPTATSPLQTNPFRTLPQPRPNSQPQVPQPHHHHHHPHVHHHHLPGPPNPFQIPLPPALQQQIAQTMAMAQNGQMNQNPAPPPQGQQPGGGIPAPENGAQAPPTGLPPLPGFGPPSDGRAVRQEGVGPNGDRWSVTYSSTIIPAQGQQPMLARPFMQPPPFGLPPRAGASPTPTEAIDRLLPRMRTILQSARQEMENVRTLLQISGQQGIQLALSNPPAWRVERIRQHIQVMGQNLNLVERGLAVIAADAAMTNNPEVMSLRQSATQLRGQLEDLNRMMDRQGHAGSSQVPPPASASTMAPTATSAFSSSQPAVTSTIPPDAPEELFLLSSPQGPVGILFDQRGTYMTAPIVPTLPFQTFTTQFAQNRQLIAGLGQQMAQNSHMHNQNAMGSAQMRNMLANTQPTPTQQPAAAVQAQNQAQAADQGQAQNPNQALNQNANVNAPANAQGDRVGNIAGHLWLIFKLACFVYFFSGTGWYKSILLGVIAGGVYLAQLGMFEEQFNLIRRHFEAVLPVGALAERAAQPAPQRTEPGRNSTPEEAARRLLQQRQDQGWIRESIRTVERSFAIFMASLWPGIGERMVHAQEERVRADRAAEEERQRLADEEQRKREEEQNKNAPAATAAEGSSDTAFSSAKGKEKAEDGGPPQASGS